MHDQCAEPSGSSVVKSVEVALDRLKSSYPVSTSIIRKAARHLCCGSALDDAPIAAHRQQ